MANPADNPLYWDILMDEDTAFVALGGPIADAITPPNQPFDTSESFSCYWIFCKSRNVATRYGQNHVYSSVVEPRCLPEAKAPSLKLIPDWHDYY